MCRKIKKYFIDRFSCMNRQVSTTTIVVCFWAAGKTVFGYRKVYMANERLLQIKDGIIGSWNQNQLHDT